MRGKNFLILNLVLLVLNAWFYARVRHASSQFDQELNSNQVASVVHEFIEKARSGRTDYSFKMHRNWVTWDSNAIASDYRLFETSHYEFTWQFNVEFEGGYIYEADVRHLGGDRWYLHSFDLRDPAYIARASIPLYALVDKSHDYMYHNKKDSVNYSALSDANAFDTRDKAYFEYLAKYCDLPSLTVKDTDSQIDIVMPNGYVFKYKSDSLVDRVSRGEPFFPKY